jgi:two-component system chemotaxis response regulator CheY
VPDEHLEAEYDVVDEAEKGVEVIDRYEETDPDLVVMDVAMPIRDGIEATAEITARYPSAKVVICTSVGRERRMERALEAGADGYVTKPYQKAGVFEEIERVLDGQETRAVSSSRISYPEPPLAIAPTSNRVAALQFFERRVEDEAERQVLCHGRLDAVAGLLEVVDAVLLGPDEFVHLEDVRFLQFVQPGVDRPGAQPRVEQLREVLHQALPVGLAVAERDEHQQHFVEGVLHQFLLEAERPVREQLFGDRVDDLLRTVARTGVVGPRGLDVRQLLVELFDRYAAGPLSTHPVSLPA